MDSTETTIAIIEAIECSCSHPKMTPRFLLTLKEWQARKYTCNRCEQLEKLKEEKQC